MYMLILLGKVLIELFSTLLWVNSLTISAF